ncbi:MAG: glucose-6-phosphate dehydrogenase assembly protein OpcA [Verrucomicrobiales bacterium]|nr:glucose-6-phosphate dehydrogenase assembly protein OpcA [Verrucomicrobiales bacterium]
MENEKSEHLKEIPTELLGKEVPVKRIDSELREYFAADTGIARASLINLAIYSESVVRVSRNTEIIQELTREHACRALLVVSQPEGEMEVRAWVQAHCNIDSGGGKAVCSEQVTFLLGGSSADLVRNIVFAHLDADLPLVFWWQGELSEVFEERLFSRIDRLVVDSRNWSDPAVQFLRLAAADREEEATYVLHDIAYTQSNQLREAVALCFDDPAALEQVNFLEEVEVVYATGQRMTAVWLVAWMANRLQMELNPALSDGETFVFEPSSGSRSALKVSLFEQVDEGKSEQISPPMLRVSLMAAEGGARFDIVRSDDGQGAGFWHLKRSIPGRAENSELWPIRSYGEVGLVGEILMRAGRNRLMIELLPRVRALLTV